MPQILVKTMQDDLTGKVFISCAANEDLRGQNILALIKVATEKVSYKIYFTLARASMT